MFSKHACLVSIDEIAYSVNMGLILF